ncbi:SAM-dependent DNA methyltransferase [Candidatus Saccharibacteria bacterium]|nr:SAM-dependent DNA methyltransferase [Candidatus Saccharibacteria bacterium]
MSETIIRKNERSWAIDMIAHINSFCKDKDLVIKRAGGENTVSTDANTMFPDLILYGDKSQSLILQGWEIKMPDVPIEDETNIKDAQRKANSLNLNSCLIWNFTHAVLFIKNDTTGEFEAIKQWDDTDYIKTRDDVKTYEKDWTTLLNKIILELNEYFVKGVFRNTPFQDIVSSSIITTLIKRNKNLVADKLKEESVRNAVMEAYIDDWWNQISYEYIRDEVDKYNAYAKTILLNWANRICFAHIIKTTQQVAFLIDDLDRDHTTPNDADEIFEKITKKSDFYNIFAPIIYSRAIPDEAWHDIIDFSNFLKESNLQNVDQKVLQNIMEGTVAEARRQINGQFTTPYPLAKVLSKITVKDWHGNILDCCCGTGTIAKATLDIKKDNLPIKEAVETVWASDKYSYLLQIANISMANADTIKIANRIFKHNALNLEIGEKIEIVDPNNGEIMPLLIPRFEAIVSNLPFVQSSNIPNEDETIIEKTGLKDLDGRLDLYGYIAIKVADLLKPGGRVGVILSNSWLGTNSGDTFVKLLREKYNILQVHISGNGKWFKNADVVATLLILEKRDSDDNVAPDTSFMLWNASLDEIATDDSKEKTLVNSSILNKEIDPGVISISKYSQSTIDELLATGVSRNALFHEIGWLSKVKDITKEISDIFDVIRGSRRGWDKLFYPDSSEHSIESEFLKPVLINAKNCDYLSAEADSSAFCCSQTIAELENNGKTGALEWINKFRTVKNGVGKLLPDVLATNGCRWYELKDNETADYFTAMNPDTRLFFGKFKQATFINQRLIGLRCKDDTTKDDIYHALLNSVLTMFFIEASGFGRGLGVLDINKEKISHCRMLNPEMLNNEQKEKIIAAFIKLKDRKILKTEDELKDPVRIAFEEEVFKAFGILEILNDVIGSLSSLQKVRKSVIAKEEL